MRSTRSTKQPRKSKFTQIFLTKLNLLRKSNFELAQRPNWKHIHSTIFIYLGELQTVRMMKMNTKNRIEGNSIVMTGEGIKEVEEKDMMIEGIEIATEKGLIGTRIEMAEIGTDRTGETKDRELMIEEEIVGITEKAETMVTGEIVQEMTGM